MRLELIAAISFLLAVTTAFSKSDDVQATKTYAFNIINNADRCSDGTHTVTVTEHTDSYITTTSGGRQTLMPCGVGPIRPSA